MGFILGRKIPPRALESSAVDFSIAFCGQFFKRADLIEQVFYNVNHGKLSSVLKLHAPTEILREIVRFVHRVRILPYNAFRRGCP